MKYWSAGVERGFETPQSLIFKIGRLRDWRGSGLPKFTQQINDSCPHPDRKILITTPTECSWIIPNCFWSNQNQSGNILLFGVLAYSKLVYDLFVKHQFKKLKWLTKKIHPEVYEIRVKTNEPEEQNELKEKYTKIS